MLIEARDALLPAEDPDAVACWPTACPRIPWSWPRSVCPTTRAAGTGRAHAHVQSPCLSGRLTWPRSSSARTRPTPWPGWCCGNALFFGRQRVADMIIPRVVFTEPEVAAVGFSPARAAAAGVAIATFEVELADVDCSVADGETRGFVRRDTDAIVGATIVAPHAGELIGEFGLAMGRGLGLAVLGGALHTYPTVALALRQVCDRYMRTRLTPLLARILGWLLAAAADGAYPASARSFWRALSLGALMMDGPASRCPLRRPR
jgi:hypothetical protein